MAMATTYELGEPVRVSGALPLGERYEVAFEAGEVRPKNEAEEHALELLVAQGLAKRADRPRKTRE